MDFWSKVWKWIDHNRFIVIAPVVSLILWFIAVGCIPVTESPIAPGKFVSAPELETEFAIWQKNQETIALKFEAAGEDLKRQEEQNAEILKFITTLASGGVADLPGLIQLLAGGGLLGALADNIRKRGLIAGLKRNAPTQ